MADGQDDRPTTSAHGPQLAVEHSQRPQSAANGNTSRPIDRDGPPPQPIDINDLTTGNGNGSQSQEFHGARQGPLIGDSQRPLQFNGNEVEQVGGLEQFPVRHPVAESDGHPDSSPTAALPSDPRNGHLAAAEQQNTQGADGNGTPADDRDIPNLSLEESLRTLEDMVARADSTSDASSETKVESDPDDIPRVPDSVADPLTPPELAVPNNSVKSATDSSATAADDRSGGSPHSGVSVADGRQPDTQGRPALLTAPRPPTRRENRSGNARTLDDPHAYPQIIDLLRRLWYIQLRTSQHEEHGAGQELRVHCAGCMDSWDEERVSEFPRCMHDNSDAWLEARAPPRQQRAARQQQMVPCDRCAMTLTTH